MTDAADGASERDAPSLSRRALHDDPPFTLCDVEVRARWLLPVVAVSFVALALLARFAALPWDRPITNWIVDHRTHTLDQLAERVTWFGSNRVVFPVAAACALLAWPRCRPLALSIVVLAASRAGITTGLKELITRDRPPASIQLVNTGGASFPSGHPFATAASWGFIPLVLALHTHRRWIWWTSVVLVWTLAAAVAWSRVWVGVHWTSDVVGGLLLAVLGVAGSERFLDVVHRRAATSRFACGISTEPAPVVVARDAPAVRHRHHRRQLRLTRRREPWNPWRS